MPAETTVIDQLRAYGDWLAAQPGTDLVAGTPVAPAAGPGRRDRPDTPTERLVSLDERRVPVGHRRRGGLVLVAAAVTIAVGVAAVLGVALVRHGADRRPTSQLPADPPGALFVLPEHVGPGEVVNPFVSPAPPASASGTGAVIARPTGEGYADPVSVAVLDAPPADFDDAWHRLDEPGPATYARDDQFMTSVTRQHGDRWVLAVGASDDQRLLIDTLSDVVVTADGGVGLTPTSPRAVVTEYAGGSVGSVDGTYLATASGIVIETAAAPDPLALPMIGVDTIQPFIVNGVQGWHATRVDPEGTWHALVWRGSPNRLVAVSATAPLEDVRQVAERLVAVDEATWVATTGWTAPAD